MNTSSEKVKQIVDTFGRLSFMLETYVKLLQTGDHPEVTDKALYAIRSDADTLAQQVWSEELENINVVKDEA